MFAVRVSSRANRLYKEEHRGIADAHFTFLEIDENGACTTARSIAHLTHGQPIALAFFFSSLERVVTWQASIIDSRAARRVRH